MYRKVLVLMLLFIVTATLTSCYDANEVDDLTYVMALGIDRGVTDTMRLTLQFSSIQEKTGGASMGGGGSSSGGGSGYATVTMDVPCFFTGLNMINSTLPRKLNFEHTKFIVFSEEIARSGDMGEYLTPLVRYHQIRKICHVIVSKGTAMDFVNANKPYIGITLSKTMEIMSAEPDNTGLFPHATLDDLYDGIKSTYQQPVAILGAVNNFKNFKQEGSKDDNGFKNGGEYYAGQLPRRGGNDIELLGCAVFDGDKMVGELDGEENRLMMMADGKFKRGFFTLQDPKSPKYAVPLDVRQVKSPEINVKIKGDKPAIHLKLHLNAEILAIPSRIEYESPELKPVLEEAFKKEIKNEMDRLMVKCTNLKADVFGFGCKAVEQFATVQEWEKFNWLKKFENATVVTEVEFKIIRTGTMLKSSPIISTKGKE
jgi:spore germination protein KC